MTGATPLDLQALLRHLRRYRIGAVYAPLPVRAAVAAALTDVAPGLTTLDLLDAVEPSALDALLASDVVAWTEACTCAPPALVAGSEALWSTLAPRKLGDVWRALVLSESPPAPRVLLLHSPLFLDRLDRAFAGSPEPDRLLRWTP